MNLFRKPSVLVLGSSGMLGQELMLQLNNLALCGKISYVCGIDHAEFDKYMLYDEFYFRRFLKNSRKFDVCVNCIAMTNTAAAESTDEGKKLSYKLNAEFPSHFAAVCRDTGVKFVHISTDYVFSAKFGQQRALFTEQDMPCPTNIYGTHKLIGENFVQLAFKNNADRFAVLRTSWLYGSANNKSFIHKIVKNAMSAAYEGKDGIEVTLNEMSSPTSTSHLSSLICMNFILSWQSGIFHAVSHETMSRSDWAALILENMYRAVDWSKYSDGNDLKFKNAFSKSFIKPVERHNMLNPEFSALRPSAKFKRSLGGSNFAVSYFILRYGQSIYDKAKSEILNSQK